MKTYIVACILLIISGINCGNASSEKWIPLGFAHQSGTHFSLYQNVETKELALDKSHHKNHEHFRVINKQEWDDIWDNPGTGSKGSYNGSGIEFDKYPNILP